MGEVFRQGMGVPITQAQLDHQLQLKANASYTPLVNNNNFYNYDSYLLLP